jgi:hypothetical protein
VVALTAGALRVDSGSFAATCPIDPADTRPLGTEDERGSMRLVTERREARPRRHAQYAGSHDGLPLRDQAHSEARRVAAAERADALPSRRARGRVPNPACNRSANIPV